MHIHDWTRVGAGNFHAFHMRWCMYLSGALNNGILPPGYYSDPEQHVGRRIADVLTLHATDSFATASPPEPPEGTAVAVAEAPPAVSRTCTLAPTYTSLRRTLTVRHTSGHRIVALIELLSPGNKASEDEVTNFVRKAREAIRSGIHLAVLDLLPPGTHDPEGIHAAITASLTGEAYELPEGNPLTFVSYAAGLSTEAYLQHPRVGEELPPLPLFLTPDYYTPLPLASSYTSAWGDVPAYWREVIEGKRDASGAV